MAKNLFLEVNAMKKQLICLIMAIIIAIIVFICEAIEGSLKPSAAIKEQVFLVAFYILSFLGDCLIFPNYKEDNTEKQQHRKMLKYSTVIFYAFEMFHFLNLMLSLWEKTSNFPVEIEQIKHMTQSLSQLFTTIWDAIIVKIIQWLETL